MLRSFLKPARALAVIALLALAAMLWRPVRQAMALATLREATKCSDLQASYSGRTSPFRSWVDSSLVSLCLQFDSGGVRYPDRGLGRMERAYLSCRALVLGEVEAVDIVNARQFPLEACEALESLPRLRRFALTTSPFAPGAPTEAELRVLCMKLRACPELTNLSLECTDLTDDALAQLRYHPELRELSIFSYERIPRFPETLAALPRLESVSTPVGLYLMGERSDTMEFCRALRKLPNLRKVQLYASDTDLMELAGHPGLEEVELMDLDITPACTVPLATLPKLKTVTLHKRHTTAELAPFRAALPGVHVGLSP